MLRYATLSLQNPLKPSIASLSVRALVIQDECALALPAAMAQQLQLEVSGVRSLWEPTGAQAVPYAGPVKLSFEGRIAYSGAMLSGNDPVIGASLARELGLQTMAQPTTAPLTQTQAQTSPVPKPAQQPAAQPAPAAPARPKTLLERKEVSDIMRFEKFIDDDMCRTIIDYANRVERKRLDVTDYDSVDKKVKGKMDISARDTYMVPIDEISDLLRGIFFNVYRQVEAFYNTKIEWWEKPQFLYYPVGGKYNTHADADEYVKKPDGTHTWEKAHDRDVSVLLYLNEDFVGGALNFPNQKIKIQPKPGLLVAFPSHHEYLHGAEPTESGLRYALVSWAAAQGTPKLRAAPYGSIFTSEFGSA